MTRASHDTTCEEPGCTNTADWLVGTVQMAEVNDLKRVCDDCHTVGNAPVERPFDPTIDDPVIPA